MTSNRAFIPEIFNYCDNLCQRCPFKYNCALSDFGNKNADTSIVYKRAETHSQKHSENSIYDVGHKMHNSEYTQLLMEAECLNVMSEVYISLFARNEKVIETSITNYISFIEKSHSKFKADYERERLYRAFDIIRYFANFIMSKIHRAIATLKAEDLLDIKSDAYGSAKVSIIAIQECIKKLGLLVQKLPDTKETIVLCQNHLKNMGEMTEILFPRWKEFVRPGFDTLIAN